MQVREATSGRQAGRKAPIEKPYTPSVEDVELDIRRFLHGHGDLPDVPLQEASLMQDVQSLLNNELLKACRIALRHWCFDNRNEVSQEDRDDMWPLQAFEMKLDELQKARLRDVILAKVRPAKS